MIGVSIAQCIKAACRISVASWAVFMLMTGPTLVHGQCVIEGIAETNPPVVTCIPNFVTNAATPNVFFDLSRLTDYTATDPEGNGEGTPSYSPSLGLPDAGGTLFPPGDTLVTISIADVCGNVGTCGFTVTNPLTELPVNVPNLDQTVDTDPNSATYTFTSSFGPGDVTQQAGVTYIYHGSTLPSVTNTVPGAPNLGVGTHTVTTVISDAVLSRTFTSTLTVEDNQNPVVTCPVNIVSDSQFVDFVATVSDNVDSALQLKLGYDPLGPGAEFPRGVTVVTVTVTDSSSNPASCQFSVTQNFVPVTGGGGGGGGGGEGGGGGAGGSGSADSGGEEENSSDESIGSSNSRSNESD